MVYPEYSMQGTVEAGKKKNTHAIVAKNEISLQTSWSCAFLRRLMLSDHNFIILLPPPQLSPGRFLDN